MHSAETSCGTKLVEGISVVKEFISRKVLAAGVRTAVALALLLIAVPAIWAQTESVLYNFTGTPDGANPTSRLTLNNGNLYGTTIYGGAYGNGSVFELSPNGTGGWNEKVIYSFCPAAPSCTDGANPTYAYVLFDSKGNIYGTAFNGGAYGDGAVFELTLSGETWTEKVLYSFANTPDGANPVNGLVMDKNGSLLGTTYAGGTNGGNGTVFQMTESAGTWTESPLYDINANGAGLFLASNGYVYGSTYATVFVLIPLPSGGYEPVKIFTFNPANASKLGSDPMGTVTVDALGNVYGTTLSGGAAGAGVVYRLSEATKGGAFKETVLATFGTKIGSNPIGGVLLDSLGNLYGTAQVGGFGKGGTVYELSPTGTGAYTQSVLVLFSGLNGGGPQGSLIQDSAGYLYGTTYQGGNEGYGVVFESNPKANVTTGTITSSLNPSIVGESVTFTATFTSPAGPPPDGEVVVFEPIGQTTMTKGVAQFTLSDLSPGTTKITAVYNGDLNFLSAKVSLDQVVNKP